MRVFVDYVRSRLNLGLNYDVVRFSGMHTLRAHIARVMDVYSIDSVIDVGANEGQFGDMIRKLGFKGVIYSFEPVKDAFEKLSKRAAIDEKWIGFRVALGAESGEAPIHVSKYSSFSSLLRPNDFAKARWENIEVTHSETVQVKTLDQCFDEKVIEREGRFLLKMDTQGYDLEVFKGVETNLPAMRCILSELSLIPIYHGMPDYREVLSVYERNGFSISGLYPITRNTDLSLNEVDCMLVNTSALPT